MKPSTAVAPEQLTTKGMVTYNNSNELSPEAKAYNAPGPWSKVYKKQLLEVGRKVESMLQEKQIVSKIKPDSGSTSTSSLSAGVKLKNCQILMKALKIVVKVRKSC